jgi:glucose-6-phosphate 1-dehydrogenase
MPTRWCFLAPPAILPTERFFPHFRPWSNVPVIGVAKAGWNLDQLKARARDSVEKHGGGLDADAFNRLCQLLRYVDGDYNEATTFLALRKEIEQANHPAHYLPSRLSRSPRWWSNSRRSDASKMRG